MTPFAIAAPARILFGRGEAAKAPALIAALGPRGIVVHGANVGRATSMLGGLSDLGCDVSAIACPSEPTLFLLEQATALGRAHRPDWVAAIGGGAALDLGKALAALIPAPGGAMDHLEVVGLGLPLTAAPLPFVALPTTAGTGAEATKNAVIGLPDHGRKVSLRDDRMLARLAIVDPALTERQSEVLRLLALGRSNREIGQMLNIAEGTVKVHVNAAFRVLGVHNRVSAAAAIRRRLDGELPDGLEEQIDSGCRTAR